MLYREDVHLRSEVCYASRILFAQNAEDKRARLATCHDKLRKRRVAIIGAVMVVMRMNIMCVVVVLVRMSMCGSSIGIVQNAEK